MNTAQIQPAATEQQYDEDALRAEVRRLQDDGMKLVAMAREAGIPNGSFTNWLGETYGGNTQRIAGQVSNWLAARVERAEAVAVMPSAPTYVDTPTARRITAHLTFAQSSPDIVVVAAGPGVGKTTAIDQFALTRPNVFVITGRKSIASAHSILGELALVMGVSERLTSRLNRAIGEKLKRRQALIVVDEAQHLTTDAMDELRSLHDLYGCGLAFVGPPAVYARIEGKGRDGNLAQLFSRLGGRMTQAKPKPEDVAALASAWGILDPKIMRLLQKIAARPGALRVMTKTLKLAAIVAAGEGNGALTVEGITTAFNQLGDTLVN